MAKKRKAKDKVVAKDIKVRDPLMQELICGATKGGAHKDRKKEADKQKCRTPIEDD